MRKIILRSYDSEWKRRFMAEENLIRGTFFDLIINLYHVGSTAILDLLSKPIIDIALESKLFPPPQFIIDEFEKIGYQIIGEAGVAGRIWFIKGKPRSVNLHYCSNDSDVIKKQLLFKSELIKSPELRRKYESIKLDNFTGKDIDSTEYAEAKSNFIKVVIEQANSKIL